VFARLERSFAATSNDGFRLLQFSVQSDHLHLLVEADTPTKFTCGVQGLAVRTAKAINRVLRRRGRLWADRFHAHVLRTPREVRNALVYVLNNARKHVPGLHGLDPRSSARFFDGWRTTTIRQVFAKMPVATPRTWLAAVGWRQRGLIDVDEAPRPRRQKR
jgi:hypothetical protein